MGDSWREQTQRNWMARCLTCGEEFPYPGIRIGAAGTPRKLLRCPRCERLRCCRVVPRRADDDAAAGSP